MARLHLFELEDQPWFPRLLRDSGTAYLRHSARIGGQGVGLVPKLAEILDACGENRILDLCSGGAGPLPGIAEKLAEGGIDVRVTLTDLYPNVSDLAYQRDLSQGRIDFVAEPVDAIDVPAELPGLRTLFNGFHHFRPDDARALLQNAVDSGQPIAIFEFVQRSILAMLAIATAPLAVLVLVPFLRPFRPWWIPLTYLIPAIPLFVLWDGMVSCLRIYSPDELRTLIEGVRGADTYDWEIGSRRIGLVPVPVTYCIGVPRRTPPVAAKASGV